MKLLLKNARIAFPCLFTPRAFEMDGDRAFSAHLIIEKGGETAAQVLNACRSAAEEKWGSAKGNALFEALRKQDRICLHDGDQKSDYDGFGGMLYVSARSPSERRPLVIDADKTHLREEEGRPYAGCYVNALLELYGQDNKYGKRINASLKGIQFVRDGDAFGGAAPAKEDDFDDVSDIGATELASLL